MMSSPRRPHAPRSFDRGLLLAAAAVSTAVLAAPGAARADWRLQLDGALARPFSHPQTDEFSVGGGGALAVEWVPVPLLGVLARVDGLALAPYAGPLSANYAHPGMGTLETVSVGARVHAFTHALGSAGDGLWLEIAGGGGLTGSEFRPLVSARAGLSFGIGRGAIGPFVGYTRVFELTPTLLAGDAQLGLVGIEVSWSPAPARAAAPRPAVAARPPARVCPPSAHFTDGDVDHDGCPDGDRDGDHIADTLDACPDAAEDRDGFQDSDGCPDPDNDADTILDVADRCPDVAENFNGVEDTDGCPDADAARMVQGRIVLAESLRFHFNSAQLDPRSAAMLDALAGTIRAHAEYGAIFIEGHADEVGGDAYNFRLSFRRAQSVVDALAARGVPAGRLEALGFGRNAPLYASGTRAARSHNRRVEFVTGGHRSTGRALQGSEYVIVRDEPATPVAAPTPPSPSSQEVSR